MGNQEHIIQSAFVKWCRLNARRFPALRFVFAVPNGGARDIRVASKLKAEGTLAGVWDMCLPVPNGVSSGLWIEFKAGRNKLTPDQERFGDAMQSAGWRLEVCRSWVEASEVVERFLQDLNTYAPDTARSLAAIANDGEAP